MHRFNRRPLAWILSVAWVCLVPFLNAAGKPLKVFLLVGQSNMQGHAQVRTLEHIGMDPGTAPLLREIQAEKGGVRVFEDVWISYLSSGGVKQGRLTSGFGADENKIGPELTFGLFMHQFLDEPILLIKAAWGGKSLHTDFRPPNAGPYEFTREQLETFKKQGKDLAVLQAEKAKATGLYYRLMLDHVRNVLSDIKRVHPDYDADLGYELAGFVWFQGWNDMVDRGVYPNRDQKGGYDRYSETLAHFIRNVRQDLGSPRLPFVIGVMGVNGPVESYAPEQRRYAGVHGNFRQAMAAPAALPEFKGTVKAVHTEIYWDLELAGLRSREAKVKQQAKQDGSRKKTGRDAQRVALDRLMAEAFTGREKEILEKGVSNAEYHYLGSAKIMAQIGKGFAEAMAELLAIGAGPK